MVIHPQQHHHKVKMVGEQLLVHLLPLIKVAQVEVVLEELVNNVLVMVHQIILFKVESVVLVSLL